MGGYDVISIEWFVLGAASIMFVYHAILYIQQKDQFMFLYANYLLSVVLYLVFRRVTGYDSFTNTTQTFAYVIDHPLILYMLFSYVYFIAKVVDINNNAKIAKFAVISFYYTISFFLALHIYKVLFTDEVAITRSFFLISKSILIIFAFTGLSGAFIARKTTFIRIILAGGVFYASFSLLTIVSVFLLRPIFGLYEYQLYFIGCLIDILLFSTALGYRSHLINQEKVETQILLTAESEKNKALLQDQHNILLRENIRKQALVTMNSKIQEQVGSSLSSIHVFADLAAKLVITNPEKSKEYLARVSVLGQELMDDIGDIIWVSTIDETEQHDAFISRVKNYCFELRKHNEVELCLQIDPNFYKTKLDGEFLNSKLAFIKSKMKDVLLDDTVRKLILAVTVNNGSPEIEITTG